MALINEFIKQLLKLYAYYNTSEKNAYKGAKQ
jgi:hypothetical protein